MNKSIGHLIRYSPLVAEAKIPELTAKDAGQRLQHMGFLEEALSYASTNLRIVLGNLLLRIQTEELYKGLGYPTWTEFMESGLPKLSKLKQRTAWEAITFAKSQVLQQMTPAQRGAIPMANTRTLVRIERVNPAKAADAETLEKAKTLPSREFKNEVGISHGYKISGWVSDKEAGKQIQRLVNFFEGASADAARAFADFLVSVDVQAVTAEGRDNAIDLILGSIVSSVGVDLKVTAGEVIDAQFVDPEAG